MSPQLDMFATAPAPKRAKPLAPASRKPAPIARNTDPVPDRPRPAEWKRLLDLVPTPDTHFMVANNWTGVVAEVLNHEAAGHHHLLADGGIMEIQFLNKQPCHTVFLTPDQARSLHVATSLIQHGRAGKNCTTFRLAGDGEDAPLILPMPEGM